MNSTVSRSDHGTFARPSRPALFTTNQDRQDGAKSSVVGKLCILDANGDPTSKRRNILDDRELIIGRDRNLCHWSFVEDKYLSRIHLRLFVTKFKDSCSKVHHLVFAEDLSRSGTFWNGSLVGHCKRTVLLSDGDQLRLSSQTSLRFCSAQDEAKDDKGVDSEQEKEMQLFDQQYTILERKIGDRPSVTTFLAMEHSTRFQLACKVVSLQEKSTSSESRARRRPHWYDEDADSSPEAIEKLERKVAIFIEEAELLSKLKHAHIIGLERVYACDNRLYIFHDLCNMGTLHDYVVGNGRGLAETTSAVMVRQICLALVYLHNEAGLVHNDVRPESILLSRSYTGLRVVLTGFTTACRLDRADSSLKPSCHIDYLAPELTKTMYENKNATKKFTTKILLRAEAWSVGVTTSFITTGSSPFVDRYGHHIRQRAEQCDRTDLQSRPMWKQLSPQAQAFIKSHLCLDPHARPGSNMSLLHAWFDTKLHKVDLDELCHRLAAGWVPRMRASPILDFLHGKAHTLKLLRCCESYTGSTKRKHVGQNVSVSPPYKPFPRKMYSTSIWGRHKRPARRMSNEARNAICELWTPEKMAEQRLRRGVALSEGFARSSPSQSSSPDSSVFMPQTPAIKASGKPLHEDSPDELVLSEPDLPWGLSSSKQQAVDQEIISTTSLKLEVVADAVRRIRSRSRSSSVDSGGTNARPRASAIFDFPSN